ncbi:hypothetical protein IFM89_008000 [Coptis chinensis]|uniref:RST domain-containing protein n=1 Tax=Coptis chinensis TaxID=261450 RepID=A0A835IM20_9MAGN|nr:hypothetical protein IFM89_008000 [Coptis chinensis]
MAFSSVHLGELHHSGKWKLIGIQDDTMHSGADVDAFTAALNRDIEGDPSSQSDTTGLLPHENNSTAKQSFPQWQVSNQEENVCVQNKEEEVKNSQNQGQTSSEVDMMQQGSGSEIQVQQSGQVREQSQLQMQQKDDQLERQTELNPHQLSKQSAVQVSEQNPVHYGGQDGTRQPENQQQFPNILKTNSPQTQTAESESRSKQVSFGVMLPVLLPLLEKKIELCSYRLYFKLWKNEIHKDGFVRHMRNIVGDQMLRQAKTPSDPNQVLTPKVEPLSNSSFPTPESNSQKSRESEHSSDSQRMNVSKVSSSSVGMNNQERDLPTVPPRGPNKQHQQHLHLPPTSYPMYGPNTSNYHVHPYSGQSIGASSTPLIPQTQDSQVRQVLHQGSAPAQSGGTTQPMSSISMTNYETQNSSNDPKRLHGGSMSHLTTNSTMQHNPVSWQSSMGKDLKAASSSSSFSAGRADLGNPVPAGTNSISSSMPTQLDHLQVPSTTTSLGTGTILKTPPKKITIGQKKSFDALGTTSTQPSKKQKVSGALSDQSIEQLNDVTAVSGVNLREEEEQLFSGPKDEGRTSEATRRVVQEEEERLILQKIPLQRKLAKIMSKSGIKTISKDLERCLSLCLEERLRGLINNLVRVSKQRVDTERSRHRTIITSDVRRQILVMNRKAKEDWEKKQSEETEKIRKVNEAEGNTGADGEKEKDEVRTKTFKVNKEEDDKMRTTAANVAARVAVGGDDMLSKWQLMAEQARQKREGVDTTSTIQIGKDVSRRSSSATGRTPRETQDAEYRSPSTAAASGTTRKFGKNAVIIPHSKVVRNISIKDVIAVLEREPQMSRSTLVYRLYEKMRANAPTAE